MAFLSIERVSKYFPVLEGASTRAGRQALFCVFKDVDLRIAPGEFVILIGHSGCGKSTLFNIVAGFEQASTGGVIMVTHDVDEAIPRPRTREAMIDTDEYTRLRSHILHFLMRGSHALGTSDA